MEKYHIIPIDDLEDHVESADCICAPSVSDIGDNTLIIHNSFDGRELCEHGNIRSN